MRNVRVVEYNAQWINMFEAEKEKLEANFPNDIYGYMDGKNKFIKETDQSALEWYKNQR